jgi:hypothetical protein
MSSARSRLRVARWAAERASYQLANRGDTHFAADKRLYKKQLTELRREWLSEDLLSRRAAYVLARDTTQKRDKQQARRAAAEERKVSSGEQARIREERMAAVALHNERDKKRIANERKVGEKALAERQAAEDAFRRQWLQSVLQDYDVDGNLPTNAFSRERKRAWLNPDNFDKRLHMLLMRAESPVDMWNSIARRLQSQEEREALNERLGGRLQHPQPDTIVGSAQGTAAGAVEASDLTSRLRAMSPGGGAGDADAPAALAGDASAAALPPPAESKSTKDAAFLEELSKTIAGLDAVGADKAPPAAAPGEPDGRKDK